MKKKLITYGIIAAILLAVGLWIRYLVKNKKLGIGQGQLEEDAKQLIAKIDEAAKE